MQKFGKEEVKRTSSNSQQFLVQGATYLAAYLKGKRLPIAGVKPVYFAFNPGLEE